MALSLSTLQTAIENAYNSEPATTVAAADALAAAYADYCSAGTFLAGTLAPLTAQKAALKATLLAAMNAYGPPSTFATAWATGVTTFWVGAVVNGTNSGATIACPGAAALSTTILAALQTFPATRAQAAQDLATLLDTATRTVTATVTLPGPPFSTVAPIV